jgi:hypothetical protein
MTWNEWPGQSVLDLDTGSRVGTVFRLVPDVRLESVAYLVLQPKDRREPLAVLPFERLAAATPILLRSSQLEPLVPQSPCWQNWLLPLPLGKPGIDPGNPSPGRCTDIQLDDLGRFTGLIFDGKTLLPMERIACAGEDVIVLHPALHQDQAPESSAETFTVSAPAPDHSTISPEKADTAPLAGRVVTRTLLDAAGNILAREGQVIDQALIDAAARAQRRVALLVHSRPSSLSSDGAEDTG